MLKRILSVASLVLIFGIIDADAAVKKHSKVVPVLVATKVAKIHPAPKPKVVKAKKTKKKAAKKKATPSLPTSNVVLARNILGESGAEEEVGRLAVAFVTAQYALENGWSIYYEVYKTRRYSWVFCKKCRKTVRETRGKPWVLVMKQADKMLKNIKPPGQYPLLWKATTYYNDKEWEKGGMYYNDKEREKDLGWILANTYPLGGCEGPDVRIGNHVFREERVHANRRGMICPRMKPTRLVRPIIPIPRMKPTKLIALSAIENALEHKHD